MPIGGYQVFIRVSHTGSITGLEKNEVGVWPDLRERGLVTRVPRRQERQHLPPFTAALTSAAPPRFAWCR